MLDDSQPAIAAALSHEWDRAISLNEHILSERQDDIAALNRLAYAYCQTGKYQEAKKTYRRILALDKYNTVARKNLEKIGSLCASDPISSQKSSCPHRLTPDTFLEEPGKTKTVLLKNVAPSAVISLLRIGEPVLLHAKKHSIDVRTEDKTYIGALPDDIAFRMLRFLKSGNVYSICIKNIQKNSISVFIRETHRGKRFSCQPTFLPTAAEFTPSILKQIDVSES